MIHSRAAAPRTPTAPATPAGLPPGPRPTRPIAEPAAIGGQGAGPGTPKSGQPRLQDPQSNRLRSPADTGKAGRRALSLTVAVTCSSGIPSFVDSVRSA